MVNVADYPLLLNLFVWKNVLHHCRYIKAVMESQDLVSVSRVVSKSIFASLGLGFRSRLGLQSYRSRDFEFYKEMV